VFCKQGVLLIAFLPAMSLAWYLLALRPFVLGRVTRRTFIWASITAATVGLISGVALGYLRMLAGTTCLESAVVGLVLGLTMTMAVTAFICGVVADRTPFAEGDKESVD
jgi:hypothetical protein